MAAQNILDTDIKYLKGVGPQRALTLAEAAGAAELTFTTGGDAPYFLENIPELTPAPPLLTIRGIATSKPATD